MRALCAMPRKRAARVLVTEKEQGAIIHKTKPTPPGPTGPDRHSTTLTRTPTHPPTTTHAPSAAACPPPNKGTGACRAGNGGATSQRQHSCTLAAKPRRTAMPIAMRAKGASRGTAHVA